VRLGLSVNDKVRDHKCIKCDYFVAKRLILRGNV
jgi:hypothetical protein